MARLRLAGDVAGFIELNAPSTAGNNTITLPTGNGTNGQALVINSSGALYWADLLATSGGTITGSVVFASGFTSSGATVFASGLTSSGTTAFASGFTSSGTTVFASGFTSSGTTTFASGAVTFISGFTSSGNVTLNGQADLRFGDADSSNWVAFQAPATIGTNVTWTLPSGDGSSNQFLKTNGSGDLSWGSPPQAMTKSMSYFYAGF